MSNEPTSPTKSLPSIRPRTDAVPRDTLVKLIAGLPADRKPAAGLGWHLGHIDGRSEVYRELGRAGDDIRVDGIPVLSQPSHLELQRRREEISHDPCRRRCDRCSQCAHAAAWHRRGGRPYAGVQAELARAGAR